MSRRFGVPSRSGGGALGHTDRVQADDDERRDLERALFARPSGGLEDESRRREAVERLRLEQEAEEAGRADEAGQADSREYARRADRREHARRADSREQAGYAEPGTLGTGTEPSSVDREADRATTPVGRRTPTAARSALIVGGALALGLVLGAVGSVLLPGAAGTPTATPSATPTDSPLDRFAAVVEGWEVTSDLPTGMGLIARGADVYTPQFETAQEDRLLLTAPGDTTLCLALQRADGTLSAGCTGLAAFFDAGSIDVVGTASGDGTPVYTRVSLRSDGSVEGGFQLVQEAAPEP